MNINLSPYKIIILLLIIGFLIIVFFYIGKFNNEIVSNPIEELKKQNGMVINIWISGKSELDILKQNKIKYLFVDIGDTWQDGKIKTSEEEITKFLDLVKNYEKENDYDFIILPYSEINTYDYDITSIDFRNNFIEDYKKLISLGFDGIYVDIEPVREGQGEIYLDLLEILSTKIPENKIIGVYSGAVFSGLIHINEWEWTIDFYKKVSENVDLIFVPGYDLGSETKNEYEETIKNQIRKLSSEEFDSEFMLGIPTHKKEPETIGNALEAYSLAIEENQNNPFIGVAVFSEWTIDRNEWNTFEKYMN